MTEAPRKYAPLSPYLMVHDGDAALDFYRRAFAADVIEVYPYEGKSFARSTTSSTAGPAR